MSLKELRKKYKELYPESKPIIEVPKTQIVPRKFLGITIGKKEIPIPEPTSLEKLRSKYKELYPEPEIAQKITPFPKPEIITEKKPKFDIELEKRLKEKGITEPKKFVNLPLETQRKILQGEIQEPIYKKVILKDLLGFKPEEKPFEIKSELDRSVRLTKDLGEAFKTTFKELPKGIVDTARGIVQSGIELPASFVLNLAQLTGVSETGRVKIPAIGEIRSLEEQWKDWQTISPNDGITALGFGSENLLKLAIFASWTKTIAEAGRVSITLWQARQSAFNESYKILGIKKGATGQQVETAFRTKALTGKYRAPDKGGSDKLFTQLKQSRDLLKGEKISYSNFVKATEEANIGNIVKKSQETKLPALMTKEVGIPIVTPPSIITPTVSPTKIAPLAITPEKGIIPLPVAEEVKIPRFKTIDDFFTEMDKPKYGKQGILVSKNNLDQVNNLFSNLDNKENLKWRGIIIDTFKGAANRDSFDLVLAKMDNTFIVAEFDNKGNFTGRIRDHATPQQDTGMFESFAIDKINIDKLPDKIPDSILKNYIQDTTPRKSLSRKTLKELTESDIKPVSKETVIEGEIAKELQPLAVEAKPVVKPDKIEYLHSGLGGVEPYSPEKILEIEKALSKAEAEKAPTELPTPAEQEVIKQTRQYKAGTKLKMAVRMLAQQKKISSSQYHEIVKFLTGRESLSAEGGATINDARKVMTYIRDIVNIRKGGKVYIPIGDHQLPLDLFKQIEKGKPADFVSNAIDPEFHALYKMGAGHIYEMMNEGKLNSMLDIKNTLNSFRQVLKPCSKEGIEKNIFLSLNGVEVSLTDADKEAVRFIKKWEEKDLRMKNTIRKDIGMPLIKPVKEYIYRMYISSVREAMKEHYQIDAGVLAGMDKYLPKEVWTPTFLKRKLTFAQALEKGLETNIQKVIDRQVNADMRFIHLTEPIRKTKKILPYYDYASQKHIRTWISEGFLNRPTAWDKAVNQFIKNRTSGKLEVFDKAIKKVGGSQSEVKALKNIIMRPAYDILFFANFTLGNRNLTQGLLDLGLIPPRDVMWGYENLFSKQGKQILSHSKMFNTRMAYEWYGQNVSTTKLAQSKAIAKKTIKTIEKSGTLYFRFVDKYPNVGGMILGSFHFFTRKGYNPTEALFLAERNAKIAQYSYLGWDMPRPFRSATLSPVYMLKSWPLYYKNYLEEGFRRLFTGEDMGGRTVSLEERLGILSYFTAVALVWYGVKKVAKKTGISTWRSVLPWQALGGTFGAGPVLKSLWGLGEIIAGYTSGYTPLVESGKEDIFKPIPIGAKRIYTFFEVMETGKTDAERMTKWEAFKRIFFVTLQQTDRQAIYNKIGKVSKKYLSTREYCLKKDIIQDKKIEKIKEYNLWAKDVLDDIADLSDYNLSPSLVKKYTIDKDDLKRWQKGDKEDKTSMERLLKIK